MSPAEELAARHTAKILARRRIERKARSLATVLRATIAHLRYDGTEGRARAIAIQLLDSLR